MMEIRKKRRENMAKPEQRRLVKEDIREEKEFRAYMAASLAAQLTRTALRSPQTGRPDEQKTPTSREEAAAAWLRARQQGGTGQPGPDRTGENR